jgi:DNA-binding transcriptional MocR family regulator
MQSPAASRLSKVVPFKRNDIDARRFSKRVLQTKSSAIRDILKVTGKSDFISFAGGLPDESLFPVEAVEKAASDAIKKLGNKCFQYSLTEGYEPLREFIADNFYKDAGLTIDNIMITHGSQQGIDLAGKIFLDQGDTVALSEPCYLGALQAFQANMVKVVTLDIANINEISVAKLAKQDFKFFYITPDFDNPTGNRMSLDQRKLFLDKTDFIILEDTAYRYLSFDNTLTKSLLELDNKDRVIQLGSFSKIVLPGLRIGWVCAPKDIISAMAISKQFSDLHSNTLGQVLLTSYFENEDWAGHIEYLRTRYKIKKDAMVNAIDKYFPEGYVVNNPGGGMFVWLSYPDTGLDFAEVLKDSVKEGIAFVPGSEFAYSLDLKSSVRLNFSHPSCEKTEEGIKKLGTLLKAHL